MSRATDGFSATTAVVPAEWAFAGGGCGDFSDNCGCLIVMRRLVFQWIEPAETLEAREVRIGGRDFGLVFDGERGEMCVCG